MSGATMMLQRVKQELQKQTARANEYKKQLDQSRFEANAFSEYIESKGHDPALVLEKAKQMKEMGDDAADIAPEVDETPEVPEVEE